MIRLRLPKPFEVLLFWHGLFAGAYTIAYLTADGARGLHQFAGYSALALLAVRLLAAYLAGDRGPWSLPLPRAGMWRAFGRKLASGDTGALLGRTPLAPLSGLVILAVLVLVTLTGLIADWWEWDDLHEGIAEGSLAVIVIHIGLVSFGPLLKKWIARRGRQLTEPVRTGA